MDIDNQERDLVWSRYNALVVAATVSLGFLAQLDAANALLGFAISVLSLLVTLAWLLITSYGWNLLHELMEPVKTDKTDKTDNTEPDKPDVYLERYKAWLDRHWGNRSQDPIWWYSHAVIALFYVGFLLLGARFLYLWCCLAAIRCWAVLIFLGVGFGALCLVGKFVHDNLPIRKKPDAKRKPAV